MQVIAIEKYHHEEHEGHKPCVRFLPTFHHTFELGANPLLRIDTLSVIDLQSHNESSTSSEKKRDGKPSTMNSQTLGTQKTYSINSLECPAL